MYFLDPSLVLAVPEDGSEELVAEKIAMKPRWYLYERKPIHE